MGSEGLSFVCASLGGLQADEDGNERYVKSSDCLENLKDLQRYMRRDHPVTRGVFLQLGKWNIVRQDLVPLIKGYSKDFELVLNCVKVLVYLTMPVDPSSDQVSQQVEYLQHFQAALVEADAIAVIVSLLEEPLEHLESGSPTEEDWKMFQLFLTLTRNFLSIPGTSPHGAAPQLSNLNDQMLELLFHENVLELVVALTLHVGKCGGLRRDNLVILEIIHHIFSGQRADLVAAAADKSAKIEKKSEKSAATLRALLESEKEYLNRVRGDGVGHSRFTGTFVQVARDGSKNIVTSNTCQSPLENFMRNPQIKRVRRIKRIVPEAHPILPTSDHIYMLLKDFADQFLSSGYNILMQSAKEDIQRDRFHAPGIVTFFQVAQFFTSYQCFIAHKYQQRQSAGGSLDGAVNGMLSQKHICGQISSTMDEDMFILVISKWEEYANSAKERNDWVPLGVSGGTVKEMIRMLSLVLKRSGSLTKEDSQEIRTARILLYKVFYDQTENGILEFLKTRIKSFDIYKQPRSHLADLVELAHIVFGIIESFNKEKESLLVLKKARVGVKKRKSTNPPGEQVENEETEEITAAVQASENDSGTDKHASGSPETVSFPMQNLDQEWSVQEEVTKDTCPTTGEAHPQKTSTINLEENDSVSPPNVDEDHGEGKDFEACIPDDNKGKELVLRTREKPLDIYETVVQFADNIVVCNYCWLLKFYASNRATTNHYIVRMLQRICEDCGLEAKLYQISILQTFYSILCDRQVQAAENHKFVVTFLSRVVHKFFKKLKTLPIMFVELLFWKTRKECHIISADYLMKSIRGGLGHSSRTDHHTNIADALGDDEDEEYIRPSTQIEDAESPCSDDDDDESISFSETQEKQIRDLFERYQNDQGIAELIAQELDSTGKYTGKQVKHKLQQLGLANLIPKNAREKLPGVRSMNKKLLVGDTSQSQSKKLNKRSTPGLVIGRKRSRSCLFSEGQDQELTKLFNRHSGGKDISKVIATSLGGSFTPDQVSRRLRRLGLIKPKPRTMLHSLHANLTDSEEDGNKVFQAFNNSTEEEGNTGLGKEGVKMSRKRRTMRVELTDSEDDEYIDRLSRQAPSLRQNIAGKEDGRNPDTGVSSPEFEDWPSVKSGADSHDSDDTLPLSSKLKVKCDTKHVLSSKSRKSAVDTYDSDDDLPLSSKLKDRCDTKRVVNSESRKSGADSHDSDDSLPLSSQLKAKCHTNHVLSSKSRKRVADSHSSGDDLPLSLKLKAKHGTKQVNSDSRKSAADAHDSGDDLPLNSKLRARSGTTDAITLKGRKNVAAEMDSDDDLPISLKFVRNSMPLQTGNPPQKASLELTGGHAEGSKCISAGKELDEVIECDLQGEGNGEVQVGMRLRHTRKRLMRKIPQPVGRSENEDDLNDE